ncbi:MAG: gliding motility-associated C-terminal domain-containing protein [Flavipsychrobacter sp.]
MKKLTPFLLVFFTLLTLLPTKARASHAAGAEMTYTWVSDSTYTITYHFYRDCSGIPTPDSVSMCYYNNCDGYQNTIYLTKTFKIIGGYDNGTEVLEGCPGHPTACAGGTIPGYQEWWYQKNVTLPSRCDHWTFAHTESARNGAIKNITADNLYVEATLDNFDDQGNSSAYFTVKPVPYVCNNIPYTYNNGAFDPNGDSLYFECITPMTSGADCGPASNESYLTGYSLPSNPLACGGTFVFSNVSGQMSFTPNLTGAYVITVKVTEYKNYSGTWKKVGSVMRDIQVVVLGCNNPNPTMNTIASTITGATYTGGKMNACATVPFGFCYDIKSSDTGAILVVTDNTKLFSTSTKPTMSYVGEKTDSVRACFSWTPGPLDTGLKVFAITVKDSTCKGIAIPISNTFVVPIYVWPSTNILSDTTICPGDSVSLNAVGGGGFVWSVLPGGDPLSSLSCTTCKITVAKPSKTTQYVVTSTLNTFCNKNKDTVTVTVVPAPTHTRIDTAACIGSTIQLDAPYTTPGAGISTAIKWTPGTYLSSSTVENPTVTPLSNMTYAVTITYAGKTRCQSKDTISVAALQYFQLFNKDTSVCRNTPIIVNATGSAHYSYSWTPTNGVSDPTILNPTITPDSSRTYYVTAKHVGCPDSTAFFTVTVQPTPLVNAGPDKTVCSGDTVHLFATVNPAGFSYIYQWTPDSLVDNPSGINTTFIGKKTSTLVFSASTAAGCKASDTVTVNVIPAKFLKISQDTGICPGDTAHLRVKGDSLVYLVWRPANFMDDSTSLTPNVWPNVSSYYVVYAKNQKNCGDTETVHVTVHPAAVINMPDSVLIYPGDSYTMNPQGNCLYYTWFPPDGLSATDISNPIAQPGSSKRYFVHGKTEAGCTIDDYIDVHVSDDSYIGIANAFQPGSGPNGVLKVSHLGNATLKSFTIYNRWGVKMFETSDINQGWDGTYNGEPQPMGVYVYIVKAVTYKGREMYKQGNITLLR